MSNGGWRDLHEQTGLSAGTVTDNDQLATDLRHLRDRSMRSEIKSGELYGRERVQRVW